MALLLIVDDDEVFRRAMARLLRLEGYQVATAADGKQALEVLHHHTPDLILLDLNMPVMDGLSFLQALRAHDRLRRLPVLLLSSQTEGVLLDSARNLADGECSAKNCGALGEFFEYVRQQIPGGALASVASSSETNGPAGRYG